MVAGPTRGQSINGRQDGRRQDIRKKGRPVAEAVCQPAKAYVSEERAKLHGKDPSAGTHDVESGAALGFRGGEKSGEPGGESPVCEQYGSGERRSEEGAPCQWRAKERADGTQLCPVHPNLGLFHLAL